MLLIKIVLQVLSKKIDEDSSTSLCETVTIILCELSCKSSLGPSYIVGSKELFVAYTSIGQEGWFSSENFEYF